MARERTIIKPVNNVLYVEPNYTHSTDMYGSNGLETYEMTPDLEDYSIFVNLEVEKIGRTIAIGNKKYVLSYVSSTDGESVNLMAGSKVPTGDGTYINSLTTNYTDLHINNMRSVGASPELFGISSIDISYRNFTVPEVTIEFVDVRGAAVFGQKELYESSNVDKAINNSNEEDIQNTFFQCFFTFPYPKFHLLVKGFYGQPVAYELTCADFRARFDSETGNFSCTAKFVGYMFSFLNDVMMNALIAAPYSDFIGAEYWQSQNYKLQGYEGGEVDVPKLAELLRRIKAVEDEADKIKQSMPEVQEKNNIEDIANTLTNIKRYYEEYVTEIKIVAGQNLPDGTTLFITDKKDNSISDGAVIIVEKDTSEPFSAYFEDNIEKEGNNFVKTFQNLVVEINKFNESNNGKQLPCPVDVTAETFTPKRRIFEKEEGGKYTIDDPDGNTNEDIKKHCEPLYNVFRQEVETQNNKNDVSTYSLYDCAYFYSDNEFVRTFNELNEEVAKRQKEVEETLASAIVDSIAKELKFYPTVENMTRIVMAHFETFAYMLFKTGLLINSEEPKRNIAKLGVLDSDDIADVREEDKNTFVPPFPKVTAIVEKDGIKNREETWPGVYGSTFKEVDLVHGILNGIAEAVDNINSGENSGGAGSTTNVRAKMKIPTSILDFIATKNSYDSFDNAEPSSLLGLVGLRALQAIGTPNFNGWDNHCDVLGYAEAENLLKTEKISSDLMAKLKGLSAADIITMLRGNEGKIPKPSSGCWPWQNQQKSVGIISGDDFNICKVETTSKNTIFTLPFQGLEWNKIKRDVLTNKSANSEDYFNISDPKSSTKNGVKDNVLTIETNLDRFQKIAESQLVDVEGIDFYRELVLKEATYNPDNYKKLFEHSNVVANYIENAKDLEPPQSSCMLPTTSAYARSIEMEWEGGYNMNDFSDEYPGGGDWKDRAGNKVKRTSGNGFEEFLNDKDTIKHTITEFAGLDKDLDPDNGTSLFAQKLYYIQNNDYVKAFMFCCSFGYVYDYDDVIEKICSKDETISFLPLPGILYAGALLWANYGNHRSLFIKCNPFDSSDNSGRVNDLMDKLHMNVRNKLIKTFEYFVTNGVKNNTFIPSFKKIKDNLELRLMRADMDFETFFNNLGEMEEHGTFFTLWSKRNWYKTGVFADRGYDNLTQFFIGELGDNFLRNFITVDEDLKGSRPNNTVGFRLGNRDGSPGIIGAVHFGLAPCIFVKNTKFFFNDSPAKLSVDSGKLENYFTGFLNRIKQESTDVIVSPGIAQAKDTDTSVEIKIGIYRYCKLLYDKWIGGISETDFKKNWSMYSFFEAPDKYFHFIDSYYNKVGQYILLNIGDYCEKVKSSYQSDQYSLLSFLSAVYAKNKFQILCVQNFLELQKLENMKRMFDCVPYTDYWDISRHPNFIVQYPYEASSHLENSDDEYTNDGFMINESESTKNKWPEALKSRIADSENDYNVPAFGVSFGKMYQSYFKDIDVSMDNPKVTEQSIKAQFQIACLNYEEGSNNDRSKVYELGQDLFSIYSNNSYTCTVTMMGCAWVQPLMYFVLNNVPMFRGTYMVINVTHRIQQGEMVTKFVGVRMANVNTRIAKELTVRGKDDKTNDGLNTGINQESIYADTDNNCPYKTFPLSVSGSDIGDLDNLQLQSKEIDSAKLLVAAFVKMGYTDVAGAAVAGNVMQETHFIPKYVNGMLKANHNPGMKGGLCQWQGVRLTRLVNWDTKASGIINSEQAMPSFGRQIEFIDKECKEVSSYKKTLNALQSATSDDKLYSATETFRANYEGGSEPEARKKYAKQILDAYRANPPYVKPPEIANNGDNHISQLANALLNSLNQTSKSSNVGVDIGVDEQKSSGDTLYLPNKSNSSKFGKVLDIILQAYSNKVSEVKWVIPSDGNQNAPPVALIVTASENSNSTKIKVVNNDNIDQTINSIAIDENGGINEEFRKAIVKKYKDNKSYVNSDVLPPLDTDGTTTNVDKLFDMHKDLLKDCETYIAEKNGSSGVSSVNNEPSSGNLDGSVSSDIKNPLMRRVLSNTDVLCLRHEYSTASSWRCVRKTNCTTYKPSETGKCTYGPSTWYNNAGSQYDLHFYPNPSEATYKNTTLRQYGLKLVWHGTVEDAKKLPNSSFRAGDVATEYYYKANGEKSAHGCMWTGSDWRSDFVQSGIMSNSKFTGREGNYSVCIWRHPDFQEEGNTVIEVS